MDSQSVEKSKGCELRIKIVRGLKRSQNESSQKRVDIM